MEPSTDKAGPEQSMLDIDQFTSLDDALTKVEEAGRGYLDVAKYGLQNKEFSELTLFFMSALSRAQGLHDAIAREMRNTNPHSVFPLLRAYAETSIMVLYVNDHPAYVRALQSRPQGKHGPRRKSLQAIISYSGKRFAGMKGVYSDLSEIGHFGSVGMWSSMSPDLANEGTFSWTSYPRWRDERTALIAAAQTLELAEATQGLLREFAVSHTRRVRKGS